MDFRETAEEGFNRNIIAATRGNHGQSIAYVARAFGVQAIVVVPQGNNLDKNRSMRALGAEVIEHVRISMRLWRVQKR